MRKFALLVLVVVFSGWSFGASAAPVQWEASSGGNDHWYQAVADSSGISWGDASTNAQVQGGYLVTLTSQDEASFASDLAFPLWSNNSAAWTERFWIGLFQNLASPSYSEPAGGWEWVTGEPYLYTELFTPSNDGGNEHYAHLSVHLASGWNDTAGFAEDRGATEVFWMKGGYIIEWDSNPIPEPSTALLLGIGMMGLGMRRRRLTRRG